jgi:hypothetical protein
MKSQKDHLATLALALTLGLVPAAALAQEPAPAPPPPAPTEVVTKDSPTAKRQKSLLKGIKLTADQQVKADSLQKRYDQQLPVLQPGTPPDSASVERMRLVFENHDTELRVALNPEQQKVFDKNREELRRQPIG